jgi:hypothetical protein
MLAALLVLAACGDLVTGGESEAQPNTDPPTPLPAGEVIEGADTNDLPGWANSWNNTDFSRRSVNLSEIMSGGVPRDGIPPIDNPTYIAFDLADVWLEDQEPVIQFELDAEARAYPLQILTWHEIVNTEVGETKVAITFCPLCNSAVSFDREVDGLGVVRLGVSGLLRHSDLVMWDDKTESLWQQITGEAIVGDLAGTSLTMLPTTIVSYEQFKNSHPEGVVLSRDTGHSRSYGNNPYAGYDNIESSPFLFNDSPDDRMAPMTRVLALELNNEAIAYPFFELEEQPVVNDELGGKPVAAFWQPGATSALDQTSIADSRDVGMAAAFNPTISGDVLTFYYDNGEIRDRETDTLWNISGHAVEGKLEGEQLEEYVSGAHFWFAWAAFQPETEIWSP